MLDVLVRNIGMPAYSIHPTIRLALWVIVVLFVQALDGLTLLLAFITLPVLGQRALRRGGRLVWRARWLLLSLLVIFSWGVPGTPLWNFGLAPSEEGMALGATHSGRIVLVLMAVATFLEYVSVKELLAATHVLLKPFRKLGLNPDRGVVRLMLVLRAIEEMPRPQDWRVLLDVSAPAGGERLEVSIQQFSASDCVIALAMLLGAGLCGYVLLV